MSRDLFDQPIEEIYEALGNDPSQWALRADALYQSAEAVYSSIGEPPNGGADIEEVWHWFCIHDVGRMLRGMALECLLKAIWLVSGEVLVKNNKFVGIPGTNNHDLYGMLNVVCSRRKLSLNEDEKKLLARLSYAITSARYPISKSPLGRYPSAPTAKCKMRWNRCLHSEDTELFQSLWTKLRVIVDDHIKNA